jgi:uncharacterized membrane protein
VKTTSFSTRFSQRNLQLNLTQNVLLAVSQHWLIIINLLIAIWVGLPWLAPVFMHWGWNSAGKAIYLLYSFQCHQLPERSFFLFGKQTMYSLADIQAAWQATTNPMILREFVGNPEMGWKVAWSDRMISMYTSILFGGLLYSLVRKRLKPLSFWTFAILLLPMVIDGSTHMISDFQGIGQGFRDTNTWLQIITQNAFSKAFYEGDALGSFNSWMRLITGILFGLGLVGFVFPHLNDLFTDGTSHDERVLVMQF